MTPERIIAMIAWLTVIILLMSRHSSKRYVDLLYSRERELLTTELRHERDKRYAAEKDRDEHQHRFLRLLDRIVEHSKPPQTILEEPLKTTPVEECEASEP